MSDRKLPLGQATQGVELLKYIHTQSHDRPMAHLIYNMESK